MPSISITSVLVDNVYSPVISNLLSESDVENITNRISRTATLDGGSVIVSSGNGEADQVLTIAFNLKNQAQKINIYAIATESIDAKISTSSGCFSGSIKTINLKDNIITIKFLVLSRLDNG